MTRERIPTEGQELADAVQAFVGHITSVEPTRENLIKGWQLFERAQNGGNRLRVKGDEEGNFHIRQIVRALERKPEESLWVDFNAAILGHMVFELATFDPMSRERGLLFEGLDEELLPKARTFCEEMNKIGRGGMVNQETG